MTGPALDLDALREKAEKATPGPWLKGDNYLIGGWWVIAPDKPAREDCHRTIADLFIHGKDAEYVAAVSPDVMLALLAENERLREALSPFATFAEHAVERGEDGYGHWLHNTGRERISTWIGPTELLRAREALAGSPAEKDQSDA